MNLRKTIENFSFLWYLPFAILQENARQMQRSRAWENYRITFRKTSQTLAFSWSRKTIDKHHVFIVFTIGNLTRKTLGKCSDRALVKCSGKQAIQQRFRGTGKQSANIMFLWNSPLVILRENAWKMPRLRAREKCRKTFRRTGYQSPDKKKNVIACTCVFSKWMIL